MNIKCVHCGRLEEEREGDPYSDLCCECKDTLGFCDVCGHNLTPIEKDNGDKICTPCRRSLSSSSIHYGAPTPPSSIPPESFFAQIMGLEQRRMQQEREEKNARDARESMEQARLVKKPLVPKEIHKQLSKFVIGQEYAKKILSVAAYNHVPSNAKSNTFLELPFSPI